MFEKYRENLEKQKHIQQFEAVLKNFECGDFKYLPQAYCGIIECDSNYIKRLGKALTIYLRKFSASKLIRLSETFRQISSMEYLYDWKNFDISKYANLFENKEDYKNILAIGTFHSNGYYRQQCLEKLAQYDNISHYIILRLNDWVEVVRKLAEKLIKEKITLCSPDEIFTLSIYMDKLFYSGRRNIKILNEIQSNIDDTINNHADEIDIYSIKQYDFETRKSIYKLLCKKSILSAKKFEKMIDLEKHNFCQSYLISHFLQLYTPDIQKIDEFLMHKSSYVRYYAMQYKYNQINNIWDGIENLLLDSRKAIREYAVFLLKKHTDFDIPQFYREKLNSENPLCAIIGLGETGIKSDTELIKPFLLSDKIKNTAFSISAINNLTGSENEDIYWHYLHNENTMICKSAYKAIIKSKIRYGAEKVYNEIINAESEVLKKYLINILCFNEDSWERLPYLLSILNHKAKYTNYFHNTLHKNIVYIAIEKRSVYKKISPELENKIRLSIEENKGNLLKQLIWGIEQDLKFMCK